MKIYEFDAVIVGTGIAGYNSADTLYNLGQRNIAIIAEDKHAGTSRNAGSDKQTYYKLSLSGDGGDSVFSMALTLFSGGAMDGDVALTEAACSTACFMKLVHLGVDFPRNEYGEYVGYKTDHDPFSRATSVGPYTSRRMTEALETEVEKKQIPIIDNAQVVKILTDNKSVTGLIAIDKTVTCRVEYIAIRTPHIVLATGGPASVYADSVYPPSHTGNSSLALTVGAEFANLSEWQYGLASIDFRWIVSGSYQQVLPRYISVDESGVEREFLREHFENDSEVLKNIFLKGYEWPFDVRKLQGSSFIDLLVYRESVVLGRSVYMDFTREPSGIEKKFDKLDEVAYNYLNNSSALVSLPIERLRKLNPDAISLYALHGIDLSQKPLRIAVCAQHNNGGIRINANWQSSIKGLYAAGEAAGSLGIFRPGGSALNSCMVGSMRAAEHIAKKSNNKVSGNFEAILQQALSCLNTFIKATAASSSTLDGMRHIYQSRMSSHFAFLRDISSMRVECMNIAEDAVNFARDNNWSGICEIPSLFKNHDIILMQCAISSAMLYSAEKYGSRGSAFIYDGHDFMLRNVLEKAEQSENSVIVTQMQSSIKTYPVLRRPIPERCLWFEQVWNNYKYLSTDC